MSNSMWAEPQVLPDVAVSGIKRVLLAEDDPEMRSLLVELLAEDGHEVVSAENGSDLLARIQAYRGEVTNGRFFDVDLIVSDIRMPGMSGLKVLSELRKVDRVTPVVLITAFGDEATHMEAHRLGVSAVFDKPFDFDAFRVYIRQLVPPRGPEPGGAFE
jgi:CheY-like chemotaxis protein